MRAAFRVEWSKLRRSRVVGVATVLMGLLLPTMGLGFYTVAVNGGTGALADKAASLLVGSGWTGYLGLVDQIAAVAMFLGAGVVVAWAFGREHTESTFSALFALPISRAAIAGAKFVALVLWLLVVTMAIGVFSVAFGVLGGVDGLDSPTLTLEVIKLLSVCLGSGALALTMAFVASVGRGYLPAIGALSVIVAITQIAVLFGTGGWFPFAIPGLLAVAGAEGVPEPSGVQVALVPAVALVGVWLTVEWWRRAEVA